MNNKGWISTACKLAMALLLIASTSISLSSCKQSVPRKYIQPKTMENILYEYHLADAMASQQRSDSLSKLSYKAHILNKYNVSEAEFDSAMVYYTRHTELLHKLYKSLSDRFTNEAMAQGASVDELNKFGEISSSSDTTDIWSGARSLLLFPDAAFNKYSFTIKADSSFHKGDRIMLDFDARYLYQDGVRSANVVLAATLSNDSVVARSLQASTSSHFHLQIDDIGRLGVKEVKGFFILNTDKSFSGRTTLRMLSLYGIRLIKMHTKAIANNAGPDNVAKTADSIGRRIPESPAPRPIANEGVPLRQNQPAPQNTWVMPQKARTMQKMR